MSCCGSSVEIQICPWATSPPCVWCSTRLIRNCGSGPGLKPGKEAPVYLDPSGIGEILVARDHD